MNDQITTKIIETEVVRLTIHSDGLVVLMLKDNGMFDSDAINEAKKNIVETLREKKAFILVELEGEAFTTKEARELAASNEHSGHHGAIALFSTKLAYRLLGTMYIKINKPKAPTRFFTKREEAIKWLRELKEINK
jgi:hypothetical protein